MLFEGSGLGFSPKVVDIFLAWGVTPLYISRKLLIPSDGDDPAGAGIFMHKYN